MFERPHHQKIAKLLRAMDSNLLARAKCYFGGGTAIALMLGEYRESVDIDFLCSDMAGYHCCATPSRHPRSARCSAHR